LFFFFSSRRRHTRSKRDWSSDVCSSDLVYITSPDYFGVMSDIEGIAEVAHAHGVPLLVDNAHGAHLRFLQGEDGCSLHPMQLGRSEERRVGQEGRARRAQWAWGRKRRRG